MLSYRHAFHAGNFADVFKHVVLRCALECLVRKPTPLLYLDTHAGAGRYALEGHMARSAREADSGVARVLAESGAPETVQHYLAQIRGMNPPGRLTHYPGSPEIARGLLRDDDRMVLCELHPADHAALTALFERRPRTQVMTSDGLAALKSQLPPSERRGLILIDPPYERAQEYRLVADALPEGLKRFATGTYLLWYPRLPGDAAAPMLKRLATRVSAPMLRLDLALGPPGDRPGMDGCGMVVVNPPWGLEASMRAALPWLAAHLGRRGGGRTDIEWLVPPRAH